MIDVIGKRTIGWILALLTVVLVVRNQQEVGLARDELVYMQSGSTYAKWWRDAITGDGWSREKITKSDVGVVAVRRMFFDSMEAVRNGKDPVAVVREPHDVIKLPLERSKFGRGAEFATQWIDRGSMRYSPPGPRSYSATGAFVERDT